MERLTGRSNDKNDRRLSCMGRCYNAGDCINCDSFENAVDRLAAYEDASEQGLLIRLPCKVGDRIYMAFVTGEIRERTVTMISTLGGELAVHYGEPCEGCVGSNDFGEWVFLTREEAEAAIKADDIPVVFKEDIEAIPAADVAPVVRCKDCVYHYYAVDCAGMCKLGIGNALLDDDFCSRGIRKGGAMMEVQDS